MLDIDDAQQLLVREHGWVSVSNLHRVPGQSAVVFKASSGHEWYLKNDSILGWRRLPPPIQLGQKFDLEVK